MTINPVGLARNPADDKLWEQERGPKGGRKWFNEQVSPETGRPCCSIADGHETQEEIRNGEYWVLIECKWFPVPPSRVIHNRGNPVGRPIVWYQKFPLPNDDDEMPIVLEINILCFVPGAGI